VRAPVAARARLIYVVRYVFCISTALLWSVVACLVGLLERSGESVMWVGRQWLRGCVWACGIRIDVEGGEHIDPDQPYVLMSNHQSAFDIAAIAVSLPVSWRFVAKRELTRIPLFGWSLALGGHVLIDRQNREAAVASLRRAAERVRAGTTVIVFPEGTRSVSGALGEFKSGGFHLALDARVPILPATVSGSARITPRRSLRIESGRILIRYGKPVPTEGLSLEDRGALKDRVRERILEGFDPALQG